MSSPQKNLIRACAKGAFDLEHRKVCWKILGHSRRLDLKAEQIFPTLLFHSGSRDEEPPLRLGAWPSGLPPPSLCLFVSCLSLSPSLSTSTVLLPSAFLSLHPVCFPLSFSLLCFLLNPSISLSPPHAHFSHDARSTCWREAKSGRGWFQSAMLWQRGAGEEAVWSQCPDDTEPDCDFSLVFPVLQLEMGTTPHPWI